MRQRHVATDTLTLLLAFAPQRTVGPCVRPGTMEADVSTVIGGSDILRETRWLAIVIIPFLAIAFVILYGFPADTELLFAWNIKPPMTAMMLGSAYAGGVWFFWRVYRARAWREVKVGFPAVGTFATLLGIATILHWDRFIHDALAFWLWVILYWTTPFLVFGTLYRQLRVDADPHVAEPVLPTAARIAFGLIGGFMVVVAVALFLAPEAFIPSWPWPLTPLTARVMSAMFALPGIVGLGIAIDPRWSVARIVLEAQVVSIALILGGAMRDRGSIDFGSPMAWVFVGGLSVFLAGLVILFAVMVRGQRPAA